MAQNSQIVRAKEKLKLSHGGSSQIQAPGVNQRTKALRHDSQLVSGLTHGRALN